MVNRYGFERMHWCPVEGCYSKTVILHFRILRFPRFHIFFLYGTGHMPVRTMFAGFCVFPNFMPF